MGIELPMKHESSLLYGPSIERFEIKCEKLSQICFFYFLMNNNLIGLDSRLDCLYFC